MGRVSGPSAAKALAALKAEKIETVHVGIFDLDATFRERRFPLERARPCFDGDYSFANVVHMWDTGDVVYDETRTVVDEPVRADPASGRRYPFEDAAAVFVADYTGPSVDFSPRELLKRQIAHADALGYRVKASLEFEVVVLDETIESLKASNFDTLKPFAPDVRCWSGMAAAEHAPFVAELQALMDALEIPLHSLGLELGPGCFEATLAARAPLRAADDAAFFKVFTKAFCRQRGLTASFMAKLSHDYPGLSGHVHLSLSDKKTGKPVFFDARKPNRMSDAMSHFVGGMLKLMPECTVLCAHTVNAYRRMAPGNWAPRTPTWAMGSYAVAVRAATPNASEARLEFRVPAADTNPYLALAMMLGLGLYGIENRIKPPAETSGDARTLELPVEKALPRHLLEAAERFEASKTARRLFGDRFVDHFVRSRKVEDTVFRRHVSGFERARYIDVV